jgi:Asp-tRNA(Asn)/Glu-tRNA(Gln) amidotransferase A subunit family amidase
LAGAGIAAAPLSALATQDKPDALLEDVKAAQRLFGLDFTDDELKGMLSELKDAVKAMNDMRKLPIHNGVAPPTVFVTLPAGKAGDVRATPSPSNAKRPAKDSDLAFMSVRDLGHLVKTKQISPVELAQFFLSRIEKYNPQLLAVVTPTPELAMKQARRAESEIARGKYRGPLHGIPTGIKDLFATKGYKTTWGAEPYREQKFEIDSAVVEMLDEAGAVICAKTTLGALAMDDKWFGGQTKNPWNTRQGSSGSSAGSCSTVAAGLLPYAIGTETLGSIISPSVRCRVTGLRPTFGRVSRYGAMTLSWTQDKVGPICREVEDCALVLAALCGSDPRDPAAVDREFVWNPSLPKGLHVGYVKGMKDHAAVKALQARGVKTSEVKFDDPPPGAYVMLSVESAAAFDAFTRGDKIDKLANSLWPAIFRGHRFVSGVDYLQFLRARTLHMRKFEEQFGDLAAVVTTGIGNDLLVSTNLTGHPQIALPWANGRSISLIGRLYDESRLLAIAKAVQDSAKYHLLRPKVFA